MPIRLHFLASLAALTASSYRPAMYRPFTLAALMMPSGRQQQMVQIIAITILLFGIGIFGLSFWGCVFWFNCSIRFKVWTRRWVVTRADPLLRATAYSLFSGCHYFSNRSGRRRLVRSIACSISQLLILASLPLSNMSGTFHPL